jgi:uridine kinase
VENRKPILVGLAGGSASGKTTLIRKISERFSNKKICVISQDHYYKGLSEQVRDKNGVVNFDHPDGINFTRLRSDLRKIIKGQTVKILEYTFNNPAIFPQLLHFNPAPIILVEGLFAFADKLLFKMYDYKVYIHADDELTLNRRIVRDTNERGMTEEEVMYQWNNHVLPAYDAFLKPHINNVNLVISNNENFEDGLNHLLTYLQNHLNQNVNINQSK